MIVNGRIFQVPNIIRASSDQRDSVTQPIFSIPNFVSSQLMIPYCWLYIRRQIRPTAVTEVTIGKKKAVWKIAEPRTFLFKRFAKKSAIAVLTGTTNKT